jgi:predicted nuclease of predicted toxin-antitoxin system
VKLWLDAQLSPRLARWLSERLRLAAVCVREVDLRDAEDEEIFFAARKADAVVMTKDHDFVLLLDQHGPPPRVLLVTAGNTSDSSMCALLELVLDDALRLLAEGEPLVEIGSGSDRPQRAS